MKSWEEFITEAKSKKEQELEDRVSELEGIPSSLKGKKKDKGKKQKKSPHTKYLEDLLKHRKEKYEDQKKTQIEKIKRKSQEKKEAEKEKHLKKASDALSGIKIRTVGKKDTSVTAVQKTAETAGSTAKGILGAAVHGVAALAAKRKAEKEAKEREEKASTSQPEMRERKAPGRPKGKKKKGQTSQEPSSMSQLSGTPERKRLVPSTKRLPPATKKLPPSGGMPIQSSPEPTKQSGMSLGQRARRNPELKKRLMSQRNELFSDWKNDFLIESGLILEVEVDNKEKKKKIVDVLRGNKKKKYYELNPSISEDHKEIESGKKKDDEGYMAKVELETMERAIKSLRKKIKRADTQIPAWVQSKITRAADYIDTASEYMQSDEKLDESNNITEIAPAVAAVASRLIPAISGRLAVSGGRAAASNIIKDKAKEIAIDRVKERMQKKISGDTNQTGSGENPIDSTIKGVGKLFKIGESSRFDEILESNKSEMKCNKPKAEAHGSGETGKSHVVKACSGGKEKLIRFGQLGVKGSPKKEGESEEYASRRHRFQSRHAKNIKKGKMSAAYWANKVKW